MSTFVDYLLKDITFLEKRIREQEEYLNYVTAIHYPVYHELYEWHKNRISSGLDRLFYFQEQLNKVCGIKKQQVIPQEST